jgi:hypothetical protein
MSLVTEQVSRRPRPEALSFGLAFPGGLKKRSQRRPLLVWSAGFGTTGVKVSFVLLILQIT